MKDVFKYLKASRGLLEAYAEDDNAKAREEAERAGGVEVRGRGKYYDKNSEFVGTVAKGKFIPPTAQERQAAAFTKNEPNIPVQNRDYPAFKKDASRAEKEQQTPSVADQQAKNVPGGPDEKAFQSGDLEKIANMMERGRTVTTAQHKKNLVKAQRDLDIYNKEQEALAAQAAGEEQAALDQEAKDAEALEKEMGTPEGRVKKPEEFKSLNQAQEESGKNVDGSLRQGDVDIATEESIGKVEEIANTDVEDQRFDKGRQSKKEFLDYYSQDSENRTGLKTLNTLATGNNREKVDQLMEAVNNGDYLEEIRITQGNKKTVSQILLDAGINVNDEAQMDCFKNAHKEINDFIDGKGKFKTSESSELTGSNLGYYEAKHIEKRNDLKTMDPAGVQTKAYNLRNDAESNMQCVTPTITDAVYNLMPTAARSQLAKSGAPGEKNHYDPTKKNRKGTANPIRGSAALHMWVMQDGKDAYATAGRRRSPGEFQVEHIVPLKSGGKDEIENFSMLLSLL